MFALVLVWLLIVFMLASMIWPEQLLDGKPWRKRQ